MWITFLGPERQKWAPNGSANHQEMLLRMYWDGNSRPAVEAPLGDFFASCFGIRNEVVKRARHRGQRHRLQLFLEDALPQVGSRSRSSMRVRSRSVCCTTTSTGLRRTTFRTTRRTSTLSTARNTRSSKGQDYLFLETKGKGHYVGTVLAVRTRSPSWFGEGDEKIYLDGERQGLDLGNGHGGLFPLRLGPEADQHALFRRALLRSMGHRRRAHLGLPLAYPRSDCLQHWH